MPTTDHDAIRVAIIAAAVVRQTFDMMEQQGEAPGPEDMARFAEEGGAIADLYEEANHADD